MRASATMLWDHDYFSYARGVVGAMQTKIGLYHVNGCPVHKSGAVVLRDFKDVVQLDDIGPWR